MFGLLFVYYLRLKKKKKDKKKLTVVQANQTFGKIGFQLNIFTF